MEEKIQQALRDFALTFAYLEDDGTYYGHDTNLGDCEEEFRLATEEIKKIFSNPQGE